jgi:hypothetical protein
MNKRMAKPQWVGASGLIVLILFALLLVSLAGWPHAVHADWRSLSGPLPAFANAPNFAISPDSTTVVFLVDRDTDDVQELYAVPITGTIPIKLNPPLVDGGDVERFAFAPDGQSVIYIADQAVDNRRELYSVPVIGGTAITLSAPLVAGGNVIKTGNMSYASAMARRPSHRQPRNPLRNPRKNLLRSQPKNLLGNLPRSQQRSRQANPPKSQQANRFGHTCRRCTTR